MESDFEERMIKYLDKSDDLSHETANLVIKNNFDSIFTNIITLMR